MFPCRQPSKLTLLESEAIQTLVLNDVLHWLVSLWNHGLNTVEGLVKASTMNHQP